MIFGFCLYRIAIIEFNCKFLIVRYEFFFSYFVHIENALISSDIYCLICKTISQSEKIYLHPINIIPITIILLNTIHTIITQFKFKKKHIENKRNMEYM